jgi:putative transposase
MITTVSLKIYEPSQRKREVLDKAFVRYRHSLQHMLDAARSGAEAVRAGNTEEQETFIRTFVSSGVLDELNEFCVQPMKDALRQVFILQLRNWFKLLTTQPTAGYPHAAKSVYFCRCSLNRDFTLVYDALKMRYYAKLHLLSSLDDPLPAPDTFSPKRFSVLGGGSLGVHAAHRYVLLPLSFGSKQLAVLELARHREARLKMAKLIKKGTEYYLNVGIDVPIPRPGAVESFLGVCRGFGRSLWYTAVDCQGELLEKGELVAGDEEQELHKAANTITAIALRLTAQVVLEKLDTRSDRLWCDGMEQEDAPFAIASYHMLCAFLQYKLPLAGAHTPVLVSPVSLFSTCPQCGNSHRRNRMTPELFLCTRCGYGASVSYVGSLNLALRLIHYSKDKVVFIVREKDSGFLLANADLGIAYSVDTLADLNEFYEHLRQAAKQRGVKGKVASLYKKLLFATDIRDMIELKREE